MLLATLAEPVRLPQLAAGPALVVPGTTAWGGPTAKTIAGATPQELAPARSARKGWFIFNFSSNDLWIDDTNDPVVNECVCVGPGQEYCCPANMVTSGRLMIMGTAGAKFAFRESF